MATDFCVIYVCDMSIVTRVYPANISANGFDNGVTRASPLIIRPFSYLHHFSSLFLALTAWFEILADNVLTIF